MKLRGLAPLLFVALGAQARASETITYIYDAQGRLTQAVHSGMVNNGVVSTYSYDNADNRTNVTVTSASYRVIVVPINGFTIIPILDP